MPSPEQLNDYFDRSGDSVLEDGDLVENENGFCVWRQHKGSLVLVQVYGDGTYWNKWAELTAKELGMKNILFATKRNPLAFCRKHGFKVTGYILQRTI